MPEADVDEPLHSTDGVEAMVYRFLDPLTDRMGG